MEKVLLQIYYLGTMLYANGAKYEGDWSNDDKHGEGKLLYS